MTFLCTFFLTNLVILAIFAKFLSNVPLSGQKSQDFVPLLGFDRLAGSYAIEIRTKRKMSGLSRDLNPGPKIRSQVQITRPKIRSWVSYNSSLATPDISLDFLV